MLLLLVPSWFAGQGAHNAAQITNPQWPDQPQATLTQPYVAPSSLTSEYQFGAHAQAIYDSQFKGSLFPTATAPPAVVSYAIAQILSPPQSFDFTLQGSFAQPLTVQGQDIGWSYSFGTHAVLADQIQPKLFAPANASQAPKPVVSFVIAGPQYVDLTLQPSIATAVNRTLFAGKIVTTFTAGPQNVDLTVPAQVWTAKVLYVPPPPSTAIEERYIGLTLAVFGKIGSV